MWSSIKYRYSGAVQYFSNKLQPVKERLLRIFIVRLFVRTFQELGEDDASHMAGGVAYFAILSLFPLLLGLIAIFGIFLPSESVQKELFNFFERNLPGSIDVLQDNIENVIRLRGSVGAVSLVLLLWSASAMFGAVGRSINRVWDIHKDRPFLIKKLRDIGMAIGTGVLFLLSIGATSVFSILSNVDVSVLAGFLEVVARLLGFLFSLGIFLALYKFVPNTKTYWRYIWPGALLAAILFEVAKSLFVLYLDHFARYESVYGSVASIIILLFWVYISAFILILGAEFSAEYGRMKERVDRGTPLQFAPSEA